MEHPKKRMKILWHDVWVDDAPLFGVGEMDGEIIFYNRHFDSDSYPEKFSYRLYHFKDEESKNLAIKSHEEYRASFGGHQDHQPDIFALAALIGRPGWRTFFDYYSHIDGNFFATVKKEDIDCFYPPNKYITKS